MKQSPRNTDCRRLGRSDVPLMTSYTKHNSPSQTAASTRRARRDHGIAREFDQNHGITEYRESVRFDRERPKKDEKKEKKNHGNFFGQKKGQN